MLKKIVFATDFSPLSKEALEYTLQLAEKTGAEVIGTHAIKPPSPIYSPLEPPETYRKDLEEKGRAKLDAFLRPADQKAIQLNGRLCQGRPEQAVTQVADDEQADLIVVAKHSRTRLEEFFLGSNTEKILRETHHPVLVVPTGGSRTVKWKSVVCATDLSQNSLEALRLASELIRTYGGGLLLMHVIDVGTDIEMQEPSEYHRSLHKRAAETLTNMIQTHGVPRDAEVAVTQGKPAARILERAQDVSSDLVILGRCGHSLTEHKVLGSTTNAILRAAHFPVMVVPTF